MTTCFLDGGVVGRRRQKPPTMNEVARASTTKKISVLQLALSCSALVKWILVLFGSFWRFSFVLFGVAVWSDSLMRDLDRSLLPLRTTVL